MSTPFEDYLNSPAGGGGTPPQGGPPSGGAGTLNPFKVMGAVDNSLQNWTAGAQQAKKVMDIGVGPFSPFMYPYPPIFPYPHIYSDGPKPSPFQAKPFVPNQPSGNLPAGAPTGPMWGPLNPEGAGNSDYIQSPGWFDQPGLNRQGVIPPPPGGWTYPTLNDFPFPSRQSGPY